MKYFYIIQRDNTIHEIDYTSEKYSKICNDWSMGGLFFVTSKNNGEKKGINSVDVKNILAEEDYDSWVESSKPNLYIKDGTWRDSKERKVVRYEKWKQQEIDSRQKLSSGDNEELTTKEKEAVLIAIPRVRKMLEEKGIIKSVNN